MHKGLLACAGSLLQAAQALILFPGSTTFPALLGHWQRAALQQAVPSSAKRKEIKYLWAELKRVEIERDILKKAVTIFSQPHS